MTDRPLRRELSEAARAATAEVTPHKGKARRGDTVFSPRAGLQNASGGAADLSRGSGLLRIKSQATWNLSTLTEQGPGLLGKATAPS